MGANAQTSVPVFTSGQVLTAQQQTEINTGIPVFADSTARDAAFGGSGEKTLAEGQFAYIEATDTTQYYDGANWQSVAPTNTKIGQVVSTAKTDTFTTTSTTFTDITGLSVSITPTLNTSKVLVCATYQDTMTESQTGFVRLMRDSTAIAIGDTAGSRTRSTTVSRGLANNEISTHSIMFLDSPATTSATTYKLQAASENASFTYFLNRSSSDSDAATRGRTASTITVMEVIV